MLDGKIERVRKVTPAIGTAMRFVCLLILFIAGMVCITATTTELPTMMTNPYPTASGPFSSQINAKLVELHETEDDLTNIKHTSYNEADLNTKIAKIKTELAELKAKAAAAMSATSGSCFTSDMRVLTEEGPKPIAEIRAGDRVLSIDEAGHQVAAEVLKTYSDKGFHYFLINKRIKVTALHRFFTDQGWKKARDLRVGDRIKMQDGLFEEIVAFEWFAEDLSVYNLTISKNHNFYISPDGKTGYLVHNTAGGGGGGGGGAGVK